MNQIERTKRGTATLWRAMPTWSKVLAIVVGVSTAIYFFQLLLGMFLLAAMAVGAYQLIKWFVSK
ncbi:MAG: hypothetical protein HC914_16215 [Chloroflexaceae bacterium]|nr:hypothetical protein [Chloroflexaceae bacterium]